MFFTLCNIVRYQRTLFITWPLFANLFEHTSNYCALSHWFFRCCDSTSCVESHLRRYLIRDCVRLGLVPVDRCNRGYTAMATAARFAAGGSNSPPTPAPATTPPVQTQTTQLIVLPASIHQVWHGSLRSCSPCRYWLPATPELILVIDLLLSAPPIERDCFVCHNLLQAIDFSFNCRTDVSCIIVCVDVSCSNVGRCRWGHRERCSGHRRVRFGTRGRIEQRECQRWPGRRSGRGNNRADPPTLHHSYRWG